MESALNKLKEPSTIRGAIVLLGLAGIFVSPDQTEAIIAFVLASVGLIEVFRKERA